MSKQDKQQCCCETNSLKKAGASSGPNWNSKYALVITALAILWGMAYVAIQPAAHWLAVGVFGLAQGSPMAESVEFFFYDTAKILLLLAALIYAIAWARAGLNVERVRDYLSGKARGLGYFLGSSFGAITPFCSCSSIPLFLGFTTANIPVGITMSFLITSPLINELAVVLLWGLLGWKITVAYVVVGMVAGIIGGYLMDALHADRWLHPAILEAIASMPAQPTPVTASASARKISLRQRHDFAWGETSSIFRRVWKWVIIGVGLGAALHGFVPDNWFAQHLGAGEWWSVPLSVLLGIPLYSSVTGIIPVMESLLGKGLPLGTTLAFCMSTVVVSLPEMIMLRQVMTPRLLAVFVGYLLTMFTLVGWLFNLLGSFTM
ncbi:permease [Desulfovibrio desulfuricans]|uniref:Permease n=2 Tax=Desulfovibrio desulfuricans TaxID=876 RepID=A0A4P7UIS1_DESDE|nr:permease [Desulfovibrio desulfuricans]